MSNWIKLSTMTERENKLVENAAPAGEPNKDPKSGKNNPDDFSVLTGVTRILNPKP